MNDDELRRDVAEEDELRRLLRRPERPAIPPFAAIAQRAHGRAAFPGRLAALVAAVVVVVAAIALSRPSLQLPAAVSASPSAAPTLGCAQPSSLELARHVTSPSLITSLSAVELSDRPTNQMRWDLRFLSAGTAPAPATVSVRVEIMAAGTSLLHVLGYESTADGRTVADGELISVAPCKAAGLVVRTAGPLLEGTWPYVVTIEKVGVPEGQTLSEKLEVTLACSNKTFTCDPVRAGATQPPGPTANMAVLKRTFGIIYWGVRQGWEPGSASQLRREGDTQSAGELTGSFFNQPYGNTSPDGRRYVYAGAPQNGPWGLYLLDGARPTERRLLVALPNEIPGRAIWSADGSAIAFTAQDSGATQGVAPKYDSIRTLDLASGKVAELARITDGSTYQLIGWDSSAATIAAAVIPYAAPASAYLVIGPAGTKTSSLDSDEYHGWAMYGAPDARSVVGIRCAAPTGCSLWTWPLADFAARVDQHLPAGLSVGVFGWRPGTDDVGLSVSSLQPLGGDAHLELWSVSAGRRTVYRLATGESTPSSPFFRADGSAIVLPGYGEGRVIDIATGATSPLPFPPPTAPWERPLPAASIRLDVP